MKTRIRGSLWKFKRVNSTSYLGSYGYQKKGDRYFILTNTINGKTKVFESAEAAKSAGWVVWKKAK